METSTYFCWVHVRGQLQTGIARCTLRQDGEKTRCHNSNQTMLEKDCIRIVAPPHPRKLMLQGIAWGFCHTFHKKPTHCFLGVLIRKLKPECCNNPLSAHAAFPSIWKGMPSATMELHGLFPAGSRYQTYTNAALYYNPKLGPDPVHQIQATLGSKCPSVTPPALHTFHHHFLKQAKQFPAQQVCQIKFY